MLLTVPWFLSIVGGRVNIDSRGEPRYKAPKLTPPENFSLTGTGVSVSKSVNIAAKFVYATAVIYLLLQVPGLFFYYDTVEEQAKGENGWAGLGFVACTISFCLYLYYQYTQKDHQEGDLGLGLRREEYLKAAILDNKIDLLGVLYEEFQYIQTSSKKSQEKTEKSPLTSSSSSSSSIPNESIERLEKLLKPFFKKYDNDNNGTLDKTEFKAVFDDIGEKVSKNELKKIFRSMDTTGKGVIFYSNFVKGMIDYVVNRPTLIAERITSIPKVYVDNATDEEEGDANDDEEDEIPEDLVSLSPDEQQRRIRQRSFFMMGVGTLFVVIFSDPMVSVLSELGVRTGVPAFYVSFVLAPLASNISEVIAAYAYATKKTSSTISISFATLLGAAVSTIILLIVLSLILVLLQLIILILILILILYR